MTSPACMWISTEVLRLAARGPEAVFWDHELDIVLGLLVGSLLARQALLLNGEEDMEPEPIRLEDDWTFREPSGAYPSGRARSSCGS